MSLLDRPVLRPIRVGIAMCCASALALVPDALADCVDRTIDPGSAPSTVVCTDGATCPEEDTYNPGPNSCVLATGGTPIPVPGRDLFYTVVMPPQSKVDVIVIPTANWDVALYATSSSDPDSVNTDLSFCIAGVDVAFTGGKEVLRGVENPGASPLTVYIIVDSASITGKFGCGPFNIEFRFDELLGASGASCTDPIVLEWTGDEVTSRVSTCGAGDVYRFSGSECRTAMVGDLVGPDVVYRVDVPADTEWSVEAEPQTDWDAAVVVVATACTGSTSDFDDSCVIAVDENRIRGDENTGPIITTEATTYHVIIDSWMDPAVSGSCGTIDLTFRKGPIVTPTGDDCADPMPIAFDGTTLVTASGWTCGATDFRSDDFDPDCPGEFIPAAGRDIFYELTVPTTGTEWSVIATPRGDWDVSLLVAANCGTASSTCVGASDFWGVGQAETIQGLTGFQTYSIMIDSKLGAVQGGCGEVELQIRSTSTPVQAITWGGIKTRYLTPDPE